MPQSNVVITGLGVVSSIGIGGDAFFENLLAKRSGVRSLSERTDGHAAPGEIDEPASLWIGAPITDFEAKQYVRPRKALKVMCREIQLSFAASQLAIEDAGLDDRLPAGPDGGFAPRDIGTVFGTEMFYGLPTETEDAVKRCFRSDGSIDPSQFGQFAMREIMPLWMLKYLPNMPACHVGIAINAHGPNNTLVLSDISGPAAMIEAATCLERGIAKLMVSGACGTRIGTTRLNYSLDYPHAEVSDPVEDSSRPHVAGSTGVVGGEAAATIILEPESEAAERGAKRLAKVKSWAHRFVPCDGMRLAQRSKELDAVGFRGSANAVRLAMKTALDDAGVAAADIGLVVSHGMGDPVMDPAERAPLTELLPDVPVVAPMASVGHTGAASGMMGLVVGAMSLSRRVVPPTRHCSDSQVPLREETEPLSGDHVLCLAHNSEGNATAVVLESV